MSDVKIRDDNRLMALVKKYLEKSLNELWESMNYKERQKVFPKLIHEFVEAAY